MEQTSSTERINARLLDKNFDRDYAINILLEAAEVDHSVYDKKKFKHISSFFSSISTILRGNRISLVSEDRLDKNTLKNPSINYNQKFKDFFEYKRNNPLIAFKMEKTYHTQMRGAETISLKVFYLDGYGTPQYLSLQRRLGINIFEKLGNFKSRKESRIKFDNLYDSLEDYLRSLTYNSEAVNYDNEPVNYNNEPTNSKKYVGHIFYAINKSYNKEVTFEIDRTTNNIISYEILHTPENQSQQFAYKTTFNEYKKTFMGMIGNLRIENFLTDTQAQMPTTSNAIQNANTNTLQQEETDETEYNDEFPSRIIAEFFGTDIGTISPSQYAEVSESVNQEAYSEQTTQYSGDLVLTELENFNFHDSNLDINSFGHPTSDNVFESQSSVAEENTSHQQKRKNCYTTNSAIIDDDYGLDNTTISTRKKSKIKSTHCSEDINEINNVTPFDSAYSNDEISDRQVRSPVLLDNTIVARSNKHSNSRSSNRSLVQDASTQTDTVSDSDKINELSVSRNTSSAHISIEEYEIYLRVKNSLELINIEEFQRCLQERNSSNG